MSALLEERVKSYLKDVKVSGQRGLVVLHSTSLEKALNWLLSVAEPSKCIVVCPRGVVSKCPQACFCTSPGAYKRVLGSEADVAVIITDGLLRPNLLAALVGVVVSGGGAIHSSSAPRHLESRPAGGLGGYRDYLLSVLSGAPLILWASLDEG